LGFVLFYLMRGDAWPRLPKWDLLFWAGLLFAEVFTRGQRIFASEVVLSMGFVVLAVGFSKLEWGHLPGRALRHVGKISFSMYVIHWGVMYWMHYFEWAAIPMQLSMPMSALHYAWRFGLLLVLAVAISTATYYCVELPGQRLGDKLIQRLQRKITSPQ
jgi:peptidoglycan/LPS O-acetylase OafA/YrhL